LVNTYDRRKNNLSHEEQRCLIKAANIAVDYIMILHNDSTGEISAEYPLRRFGHTYAQSPIQSRRALYGLSYYAHLFKEIDPSRAQKAFEKALKTIKYLEKIDQLTLELKVVANYHFFKYSGNEKYKKLAISTLNKQLANYERFGPGLCDILISSQSYFRAIPYFEGLYYCVKEFEDYPNYSMWLKRAKIIDEKYIQKILNRNGFNVIPEGGKKEWADMKSIPPERMRKYRGELNEWGSFYPNTHFASWILDAIFLAEVTDNQSLEKIAAASLGWITGLNPGVPGEMVVNPYHKRQTITSAAFIMNLDARHVKPWIEWWWAPTTSMMSIVNGFVIRNGKFDYYDKGSFFAGETYLLHDGTYLFAMCLYDEYLYKK